MDPVVWRIGIGTFGLTPDRSRSDRGSFFGVTSAETSHTFDLLC